MSIAAVIITCDICPTAHPFAGPPSIAQGTAKKTGWLGLPGRKHLCPACVQKAHAILDKKEPPAP